MEYTILFDFGSTFTKAAVVSNVEGIVITTVKYPSTVKTDARIAMKQCIAEIEKIIGKESTIKAKKYASSSAAGGLRIAVVGLTHNLSVSAGRNAAFGAGAKIIHITSGLLDDGGIKILETLPVEMILFCGGYENGNKTVLMHNAEKLADSALHVPIIYGGNSVVGERIREILFRKGKECFLVPNIIPEVGVTCIEESVKIIRNLFMQRIVNMKGLGEITGILDAPVVPTPAAVLDAGKLLSKGTEIEAGIGELMLVDIGGATTDIHSYAEQCPFEGARIIGAEEPYAKRTVEGDLGMRESSDIMLRELGISFFSRELEMEENKIIDSVARRVKNTDYLPSTEDEIRVDQILAESAAYLAARRHCGKIEYHQSNYCQRIQIGKNLTHVQHIIGTGGVIINNKCPSKVLEHALWRKEDGELLLPRQAEFIVDHDYILYAAGLLSYVNKDLAFSVLKHSLLHKN